MLRLVQDHIAEGLLFEPVDVLRHGAVGGEDDIVILEALRVLLTGVAVVNEHLERRRELFRFRLPVEHQRFGGHNEVGRIGFAPPDAQQEGERLHRFAQAHIIGQNTTKAELVQKVQPVVAGRLVLPQISLELFG